MATQRLIPGGPGIEETATAQRLIPGGPGIGEAAGASPVTHTATGALTGAGATVAGAASRTRVHSASGALIGPGASIAGAALRFRSHSASGALEGGVAVVTGAADVDAPRRVPAHKRDTGQVYYPRFRTSEEIRRDRDARKGIPKPVEEVVEKIAEQVIAKAAQQDASPTKADPLEWLRVNYEQQQAALAADLKRLKIKATQDQRRDFMILLSLQIEAMVALKIETDERLQAEEDEQIVMLLMEM